MLLGKAQQTKAYAIVFFFTEERSENSIFLMYNEGDTFIERLVV